jgi:hypothetical protein
LCTEKELASLGLHHCLLHKSILGCKPSPREKPGGISMAYEAQKTEHTGPKKGRGAYWGRKQAAKKESNRVRREADKNESKPVTDSDGKSKE